MKISTATLLILGNMAKLNQHIVIKPGSSLRTVNDKGTTMIEAKVDEKFPVEIALHDLSGFLKVISLFEEPEFEFQDKLVLITDDSGAKQKYYYSDKSELIFNDKEPRKLEYDINFKLSNEILGRTIKSAGVNGTEDIAFVGENEKLYIKALDKENPTRQFSIEVSSENHGNFVGYIKHTKKGNKLMMLPIDYDVSINKLGVIQFTAEIEDFSVTYTMAMERDSEF